MQLRCTIPILAVSLLLLAPPTLAAQLPTHAEFAREVEQVCGVDSVNTNSDALLALDGKLADAAPADPLDRPVVWRLACIRARLAVNGAIGRESYLMPLGSSWRHGASMLTGQLLDDSVTTHAAELLAVLNADPVVGEPAEWTLDHLEAAIGAGVDAAIVDRECALIAWQIEAESRARSCASTGLASGHDSTFHLLTMSRAAALDADTGTALMAFLTAARSMHDSTDRADLYWHLRWFLKPSEDSAWRHVPDDSASRWLHDLLEVRDVRDGRAPGSRVVEHFRRLAFVKHNFRLMVLPINRDRIMNAVANPDAQGGLSSVYSATPTSMTPALAFRDFVRWQSEFDDRGVVWMRFGAPEKRWFYTAPGGCASLGICNYIHRETWRYHLDGQTMLLSFESEQLDGSQDATRLVTGVVGDHFCGLDSGRCFVGERAIAGQAWNGWTGATGPDRLGIPPEEMSDLRRRDSAQISQATTRDDNSERAPEHLTVNARYLRLWKPGTGQLVALVPWAIRARDLASFRDDSSGTVPVRLQIRSYDSALQVQHDSLFVGNLVVPSHPGSNGYVIGYVLLPATVGVSAWSVRASHDTIAAGRIFQTAASPLATGQLRLSDLVIGTDRQGVTWPAATGPIAMAPLGAVRSDRPVQLYYQVMSGLTAGEFKTTVAVYRSGTRDTLPSLEVSFTDRLKKGLNEMRRELGVSQLRNGAYRLEVRVEDQSGRNQVSRSTPLLVVK